MKVLTGILLMVLVTGPVMASMPNYKNNALQKAMTENVEAWKKAYNSGDAMNLEPLYSEGAVYTSSHVEGLEAIGRENVINNFQKGISGGGHIDQIDILSMERDGKLITLFCKYQATNSGVTFNGRNLLVLRKIRGEWLIVLHMTVV